MYKTAVYALVNGGVQGLTHQKQQKSLKNVISFSSTLTHSQCAAGSARSPWNPLSQIQRLSPRLPTRLRPWMPLGDLGCPD